MDTLEQRREKISIKFAKGALKSEKFKKWFSFNDTSEQNIKTRSFKSRPRLKPVTVRKARYRNSPLPYLTELLNKQK